MCVFDDDDLPERDVVSSDDALRDAFSSSLTANQPCWPAMAPKSKSTALRALSTAILGWA